MLRLPPPPPPPPGTENQPSTSQDNEASANDSAAANNNIVANTQSSTPQTLDPKKLPYQAWSPSTEVGESEGDSTLYAELDKHWRNGAATGDEAGASTASADVASTCTKDSNTPNGEGPPGYSLHLKPPDSTSEDIYTHV